MRRFFAGEHEFAVARLDGKAYATSNYCTHLDCLLSSGKLVDDGIGCSCHGSVFDLETGEPIYPPATEPIKTYPVRGTDGEIFVGVEPGDARAGPAPAGRAGVREVGPARSPLDTLRRRHGQRPVIPRPARSVPACWPTAATPSTRPWPWPR